MTSEHTLRLFDEQLEELRDSVLAMGRAVDAELGSALEGLLDADAKAATAAIEADPTIDALHGRIREQVLLLLARMQPVADDLRAVIAAERIAVFLERAGDHAKNCAKHVLVLDRRPSAQVLSQLAWLAERARAELEGVVQAYARGDAEAARRAWISDEELDRLYRRLFGSLLEEMTTDPARIATCTHLLFVAKSLERVGDYATNIAEEVVFAITGGILEGVARPRSESIL